MLKRICLCISLCMLAYGLPAVAANRQIAREVATAFDQAAKEHAVVRVETISQFDTIATSQQSDQSNSALFKGWTLSFAGVEGKQLNYSTAMEDLVKRVRVLDDAGNLDKVIDYCRIVVPYLQAAQASHKALACEFLAHFPASAVDAGALPHIGALLDDATVAFQGVRESVPQSVQMPFLYTPMAMSVADMAQMALSSVTDCQFSNREVFQRWWPENKDYVNHLWYWVVRYQDTPEIRAKLSRLSPLQTLKVYLLLDNLTARRNEMETPWRKAGLQPPQNFATNMYRANSPDPIQVGKFVADHHLQEQLFDLLSGAITWPDVKDNTGWGETALGMRITEVGRHCWTREDTMTIERILNSGRGLAVHEIRVQTGLTQVAVSLDNARLESILLGQLARNPRQPELATLLLANTGLKHWDIIRSCYDKFNGYGEEQLITALGEMATRNDMRAMLCQLFAEDHLEAVLTPDGRVANDDSPRRNRLSAYARAAERINGGMPVVDPKVLQAAISCGIGKIDETTSEAQIAAMPGARTEAIKQLTAFFAKIKEGC
ncbi:MAG TPA: hypothetical protein VHV83_01610 [Armatimonadota bacterium]|nr:hypothetical protein [Armatimonadota bacterium]